MPPKRKANGLQQELPTRPEPPRRSSRRIKEVAEQEDSSPHTLPDDDRLEKMTQDRIKHVWESKETVEQARRELTEMEYNLQRAVKRQRLAVESSDLICEVDRAREVTLYHQEKRDPVEVLKTGSKSISDAIEHAPIDEYEAEIAVGDITEAKIEEDGFDRGARRPPAVNSDVLPLPWTGRLGYACLNTYLRTSTPPVFSSRTCRISSIIDHRHPLQDPSQPEHPTKNRPDKSKPQNKELGMKFVQNLGLANAGDIPKMIRWNDKYGIKFMRLSSEMFPFASHDDYGYKLAPFASEVLAEAGKVIAELGHRVTTHPGQFTQIGSPRPEVVAAAIRDLAYHDEMLSLLQLPEQANKDAVMILHMGGTYGDKEATIERFKQNYSGLSQGVKNRLVLENDDVSWSVHDLLPVCEELNIPLVLDFHHHNIVFDSSIREGTQDIIQFFDRIRKTWTRKGIRQKMHYSEQTAGAITARDRRKHSARVKTLPPCAPDMDLMIEAKDKEQAVFELMRTFKLPGWDLFNPIVPNERDDESKKPAAKSKKEKKTADKGKKEKKIEGQDEDHIEADAEIPGQAVSNEDFGMGGPENRVYWPEGMEEWLKPKKREMKKGKKGSDK
ncbi:unnamed protein product [Clonostachys byssicola]|uniref:UV-damage endonuclease n=1 Tax=Clonostachys byssicola TaxID=160290 RepID=A0A9N9U336_9HYPO|nr:unnamed protein product [Clonostachys byssicola]